MPGGDGTGPMGRGSMTGRGLGFCAGVAIPALAGFALGRSRGRGRRTTFHATGLTGWQRAAMAAGAATPESASPAVNVGKQTLATEIETMQSQLDAMRKRLAEMESSQQ